MMKRLLITIFLLLLPAVGNATVLAQGSFESGMTPFTGPYYGGAEIVTDGTAPNGTKSLRFNFTTGFTPGNSPDIIPVSFTASNEIYVQYYIKYASNFNFGSLGTKNGYVWLNSAVTENVYFSMEGSWGETFSFHTQHNANSNLNQSFYYYGSNIVPGTWYKVVMRLKVNTAGVNDGIIQVWLDDIGGSAYSDTLIINQSNILYRMAGLSSQFDTFQFSPFTGLSFSETTYVYNDHAIVQTTPFGEGDGDVTKPYPSQWSPSKSSTGIAVSNRTISFHIQDDTDVLTAYGTVNIEGVDYTCAAGLTCTGGSTDKTITYTKGSDWDYSQTVNVITSGFRDTAGNVMNTDTWSYTTAAAPASFPVSSVQSASNEGIPASATFGSTPTDNNLLVAIAANRSGVSHADFAISGTGWTKRIGRDTELTDVQARRSLAVWTKTAGESEPTNVQVSGSGAQYRLLIREYDAGVSNEEWTFEAQASNDTGTGSTSPLSSGTTASVTTDNLAVITAGAWRNQSSVAPTGISWTNDIGGIVNSTGGNNQISLSSGFLSTTTGGTKSSSVSWSGSGLEASAGILVFSVTAAAAGGEVPVPVEITTSSPLTTRTQGTSFSETFTATGGTSPYTWSVDSGALPDGTTLSSGGVFSGTPSTFGPYNFTVKAIDAVASEATKALSIIVNPAAPGGQVTANVTDIQDTLINSGSPTTNYSDNTFTEVYQWPMGTKANIALDNVPISLPDNVSIVSARYYAYDNTYEGSGGSDPMRVYASRVDPQDISTVTWATFDNSFQTYESVTEVPLTPGWVSWDIKNMVAWAYANGSPLYMARDGGPDGAADTNRIFTSVEGPEGYRPFVSITYMQLVAPEGPSISAPGKMRVSKFNGVMK